MAPPHSSENCKIESSLGNNKAPAPPAPKHKSTPQNAGRSDRGSSVKVTATSTGRDPKEKAKKCSDPNAQSAQQAAAGLEGVSTADNNGRKQKANTAQQSIMRPEGASASGNNGLKQKAKGKTETNAKPVQHAASLQGASITVNNTLAENVKSSEAKKKSQAAQQPKGSDGVLINFNNVKFNALMEQKTKGLVEKINERPRATQQSADLLGTSASGNDYSKEKAKEKAERNVKTAQQVTHPQGRLTKNDKGSNGMSETKAKNKNKVQTAQQAGSLQGASVTGNNDLKDRPKSSEARKKTRPAQQASSGAASAVRVETSEAKDMYKAASNTKTVQHASEAASVMNKQANGQAKDKAKKAKTAQSATNFESAVEKSDSGSKEKAESSERKSETAQLGAGSKGTSTLNKDGSKEKTKASMEEKQTTARRGGSSTPGLTTRNDGPNGKANVLAGKASAAQSTKGREPESNRSNNGSKGKTALSTINAVSKKKAIASAEGEKAMHAQPDAGSVSQLTMGDNGLREKATAFVEKTDAQHATDSGGAPTTSNNTSTATKVLEEEAKAVVSEESDTDSDSSDSASETSDDSWTRNNIWLGKAKKVRPTADSEDTIAEPDIVVQRRMLHEAFEKNRRQFLKRELNRLMKHLLEALKSFCGQSKFDDSCVGNFLNHPKIKSNRSLFRPFSRLHSMILLALRRIRNQNDNLALPEPNQLNILLSDVLSKGLLGGSAPNEHALYIQTVIMQVFKKYNQDLKACLKMLGDE